MAMEVSMSRMMPVLLFWLVSGAIAEAETTDAQLAAPIVKFINSFNQGDAAAAASTHAVTADLAIIDEVPPYLWRGPDAFQSWSADLERDAMANGITDQVVTLGDPTRKELAGDRAYVIVPVVYTFKERGVAMSETAQMTFALVRSDGGWLIHGWTWTGPAPQPVVAPDQ